jgi:hypothetical protein
MRLRSSIKGAYGGEFSPVIYVDEEKAAMQLYSHARWIALSVVAVSNAEIKVRVADCVRTNDTNLCQHVEATS